MRLYVIRHAEAVDVETKGVKGDEDRWLTEEGKEASRAAAQALAKLGVRLDLILTSPWRRAVETAEILAQASGAAKPDVTASLEPPINLKRLDERIVKAQVESIAITGHAPSLNEYVSRLVFGDGAGLIKLGKASVCCVELEPDEDPLRGELLWLLTAKQLKIIAC